MKLQTKLMLAPLAAGAVLFGTIGASGWALSSFRTASHAAYAQSQAAQTRTEELRATLAELHAQLYRTMAIIGSLDDAAIKKAREQLPQQSRQVATAALQLADASALPEVQAQAQILKGVADRYAKAADAAIDMASVDANTGIAALQNADTEFTAMSGALGAISRAVEASASSSVRGLEQQSQRQSIVFGALALLAGAAALAFGFFTLRRALRELKVAADAARRVAAGDLGVDLATRRTDELGDMLRALDSMVQQLRRSIGTVKEAADAIALATGEVAQGNADLSSRTEETASSLQQTASSMEQITGTVRHSADAAAQANELAASAAAVAQRGGHVVSQVVGTMDEIQASSRKIADITGVIDGIAFQTNILALNAAVEAARAGEQGRGFAVVAGEVRSLAQRSAEAAKQIKGLIGASVDKVASGSRLVQDAGSTMSEIQASVQRVSDIIGQISSATAEQSTGIGEVNTAVGELDRMTQQNAALVEQSAAAAASLQDQADRLAGAVASFRLGSETGASAAQVAELHEDAPRHASAGVELPTLTQTLQAA